MEKFQNLKIYLFICLAIQCVALPREAIGENKVSSEILALNNYALNHKLLNIENQTLEAELFYFNDELNILNKRINSLLRN